MSTQWTENRRKVARFLDQYFSQYGRSPSLDEIAEGTGLWKRSVEIVLKGLEKMGIIAITPGISRGIRLIEKEMARVPLLGEVQAGAPALAQEGEVEYLRIKRELIPFAEPVALRVSGYSMKDAGILPGDIILLKQQEVANNGDTVVAYFNGGLTVKTLSVKGNKIQLKPANPSYKMTDVTRDDDFRIVGKVMLVLRDLGSCLDFRIEGARLN